MAQAAPAHPRAGPNAHTRALNKAPEELGRLAS
jgi:hypothetical protein